MTADASAVGRVRSAQTCTAHRACGELDDDGGLPRAELALVGGARLPDLELAGEELVGRADFAEMVGARDAAISDPRPGLLR
jgi:hypothetical protein